MMHNKHEIMTFTGPVGRLEALYLPAKGDEQGVAVINHPNPLHGGTFTNKVIQTAAKALSELGFHCYLPNLRGVGGSDGSHDYGRGETDDCLSVIEQARQRHPDAARLVVAGFSFGGYVALFAARACRPDALLLLAPAVGMYDVPAADAFDAAKTLLIHGATDDVVALENALDWAAEQAMPVVVIPDAGHFFHGKLMILRTQIGRLMPMLLD